MADETAINGEFSDDRFVKITEDETLAKISRLTAKVDDLEGQNAEIIQENEQLKASIKELSAEIVELKKELDKAESENKALDAVAARASELEAEVSRLQHDLVSAMSDLQESSNELSSLKNVFDVVKENEKAKDVKLDALVKEGELLLTNVGKLEGVEIGLRLQLEDKDKESRGLKKIIEDLKAAAGSSKRSENAKNELEKEIEKLKAEISTLQSSLKDKESVISEFEMKVANGISGYGETKITKQMDWAIVWGSAVAAAAVMGVVCYVQARRC